MKTNFQPQIEEKCGNSVGTLDSFLDTSKVIVQRLKLALVNVKKKLECIAQVTNHTFPPGGPSKYSEQNVNNKQLVLRNCVNNDSLRSVSSGILYLPSAQRELKTALVFAFWFPF